MVRSLAEAAGKINNVSLLGYDGKVEWQQTAEGLVVTLPEQKVSEYTCAVKITGTDLKPVGIPQATTTIRSEANGSYTLGADAAELHGDQIKQEAQGGQPNIGFWDKADEWVSWKVKFRKAGHLQSQRQHRFAQWGCRVRCGGCRPAARRQGTADRRLDGVSETEVGQLNIEQPGDQTIKLRPKDAASWKAINLRFLKLTPASKCPLLSPANPAIRAGSQSRG